MNAKTNSDFFHMLHPARRTAVVDIGANPIDGAPPYQTMLDLGLCTVVGFDPQPSVIDELQPKCSEQEKYLPYAVGDGTEQTLHVCAISGMTSFLQPDQRTLALFARFSEFGRVVTKKRLPTKRLDDIEEIAALDFLKIDVQGYEMEVFQSGRKKLAEAVAIQTEISFVPLYEGQPPFGIVDTELRSQGFIPHILAEIKRWVIVPKQLDAAQWPSQQLLEADLVYVRDFRRPELFTDEQLTQLALIAHYCYHSIDLALYCLAELASRGVVQADVRDTYYNTRGYS